MRILVATATAAMVLGGVAFAATPQNDPCAATDRGISLFVLLKNSMSGVYDACLDELRDKVARVRLRARILQAEATRLEAEAGKLEGERAAAARRLAAANTRQAKAFERLKAAKKSHIVDRARLREVITQGEELARELEALNRENSVNTAQIERLERLERKQEDMYRRLDAMLGEG